MRAPQICLWIAILAMPAVSEGASAQRADPPLGNAGDTPAQTTRSSELNRSPFPTAEDQPAELNVVKLQDELNELQDLLNAQTKAFQQKLNDQELEIENLEKQLADPNKQSVTPSQPPAVNPSSPKPSNDKPPAAPLPIPAIVPFRPFPVGGLQRGNLKPAFTVGSVRVTPFASIKATSIHDTSSPGGDDFPLPGFLADSGPTPAPEFHVKTRSSRFGANFEWMDASENLAITGRFEFDFEGNFSRADNRNLSAIRSNMPSLRVAYARLDYKLTDRDVLSALFGQDWTPFGSSTLAPLLETTGIGIGFGGLWERQPQMRFGWTHNFGKWQLMPEFAVALPASGNTPAAADLFNQLGYGERQGADSDQPQLQSRLVFQWQLDHAAAVAPAQIIFSGEYGRRTAIVLGSAVPASFAGAFRSGATVGSNTYGWTAEWQLPTRFATLFGKYYSGSDLRWFFGGQLFSNFNDTAGLTATATALSTDGASTVVFGNRNGQPVVAPQRPIRAGGGFASIGLPLSRLFNFDPEGRNTGWVAYFTYGTDQAKTRDLLRAQPNGSRGRSDMTVGSLQYKLNTWVSFAFEQSLYRTRANTAAAGLPLFMGAPQHEWKDIRSEGGTIFSF